MSKPAYLNPYSAPGTNQLLWSGAGNAARIHYWQSPVQFQQTLFPTGNHSTKWRKGYTPGDRGRMWTK